MPSMMKRLQRLSKDHMILVSLLCFFGGMIVAYEDRGLSMGIGATVAMIGLYGLLYTINLEEDDDIS